MNFYRLTLISLILIILSVSAACAADSAGNLTVDDSPESVPGNVTHEKETVSFEINSTQITTGESIGISMMDSNNLTLANKNLTAVVSNKAHSLVTDNDGNAALKLDLPSKKYVLQVIFEGDENYSSSNQSFSINVLKIATLITVGADSVKQGDKFQAKLTDISGNSLKDAKVSFIINEKTFTDKTDSKGRADFTAKLANGIYDLNICYGGNKYYESANRTVRLLVYVTTSIVIGNSRLLTNGYLRVYLLSDDESVLANKKVKITVNGKNFTKKTNSEGIIIFKPKQGTGKFRVKAEFSGNSSIIKSEASKKVTGIKGNVKSPQKSKIPLRKGVPDIDLMPKNYVMANENMTYTLTKAQYLEVIKRDSYCLFLNNKLSRYTFFKSVSEPGLNHIVKREKWNVIERAVNTKIVKKNKNGYWPASVKVCLKGKSYTYAEVRDVQDTDYSCGPTSCSMCTQVLKNYQCEKYLIKKAGTSARYGSSAGGLKSGLEKCGFKCSIYYKSSFSDALNQLKKGGCALVFHTWGHFVSILDISKDGKKVLVGNPSGDYDHGSHKIPTKWLSVEYMKKRFNNYNTAGLIIKLNYKLNKSVKEKINTFYSSMGTGWTRQNVNERLPQI